MEPDTDTPPPTETPMPAGSAAGVPEGAAPARAKPKGRPSRSRGAPKNSDKGADKWTMRGVPLNIRKLAAAEAAQRRMNLGDFVAEAVVGYLKGKTAPDIVVTGVPAAPKPEELAATMVTLLERMAALETQRRGLWSRIFGSR